MKVEDLRRLISVRPFRPMELRTSDGEVYRLVSPEVMVDDTMTVLLDDGKFRFIDNERPARGPTRRFRSIGSSELGCRR
ncbi:MAG: hypothetical protein HYY93_15755 [Planctomycetes bacterium]|nr:hypothetical protein [Planctomycetota bacterium]